MEIPDIIVVNKADHPLTDTMVREIKGVLALGPRVGWQVPILRDRGRPRGRASRSSSTSSPSTAPTSTPKARCPSAAARNLRSEVLAIATYRMRRELEAAIARGRGRRGAARPGRRARARSGQRRRRDPRRAQIARGRAIAWSGAHAPQRAGDHQLLDLVGPLADREDLRIAVEAADRILLDVAVAAVDLDGLVGRVHRQAPALQLRLRGRQREAAALILQPGGLLDQQPAASISTDMSASFAWIAWKREIGPPNAWRCLA